MPLEMVRLGTPVSVSGIEPPLARTDKIDAILLRCSGNSHNNLRRAMRMRAEKTIPHGGVWTAVEGGKVVGLMICDLPGQDSPEASVQV